MSVKSYPLYPDASYTSQQEQHDVELARASLDNTTHYIGCPSFFCPSFLSCVLGTLIPCGFLTSCVQVNEREEMVLLNWGRYHGVIRQPGLYWLNPYGFQLGANCVHELCWDKRVVSTAIQAMDIPAAKVIDGRGNPLRVSGVVTYQIVDAKCAIIDVKDWSSYLSTRAEVVLKQICSSHPYESDVFGEDSLKREAEKVRHEIKQLLQFKVTVAGIHIHNFEFKEISYAPEIAAQMLVRQQAEATLSARKVVVQGAVGIAWDAITHFRNGGLEFTPADASKFASNLVVTMCSESRVTPTISLS